MRTDRHVANRRFPPFCERSYKLKQYGQCLCFYSFVTQIFIVRFLGFLHKFESTTIVGDCCLLECNS
jgi:hypothetical protein